MGLLKHPLKTEVSYIRGVTKIWDRMGWDETVLNTKLQDRTGHENLYSYSDL